MNLHYIQFVKYTLNLVLICLYMLSHCTTIYFYNFLNICLWFYTTLHSCIIRLHMSIIKKILIECRSRPVRTIWRSRRWWLGRSPRVRFARWSWWLRGASRPASTVSLLLQNNSNSIYQLNLLKCLIVQRSSQSGCPEQWRSANTAAHVDTEAVPRQSGWLNFRFGCHQQVQRVQTRLPATATERVLRHAQGWGMVSALCQCKFQDFHVAQNAQFEGWTCRKRITQHSDTSPQQQKHIIYIIDFSPSFSTAASVLETHSATTTTLRRSLARCMSS